jgi:zinc protease
MSTKRLKSAITPQSSVPCAKNIADTRLSNGIRVLVYENFASPAVVINGYFVAGARDETTDKAGLAGFVADALARGTQNRSYHDIFEQTESIGASVGVSCAMHTSSLYAKGLAEDLPFLLDLLSDQIRYPTFPPHELEKERAEWLTELEERKNDTRAMAGMAFSQLCYPADHPYHRPADGTPETARAITYDDVTHFHRTYYTPQDMVIAVVGAAGASEALRCVSNAFADWTATRPIRHDMPAAPKPNGVVRQHIAMPGKSQSNLIWGYPSLPRSHPDWMACALMNSILGQFGMYGRMGESVRKEEGLVYYIGSRFEGGPGPGSWSCYAGTHASTIERVLEISRAEVRRIQQKKVKAAELEDNKLYFTGSVPLGLETNEGIAGQIVSQVRYGLGLDHLLEYPDLVNAVTLSDIQRVAQTWLDADNFVLATAGA